MRRARCAGRLATRRHSSACGSRGSAPPSQPSSQSRRQAWYFSNTLGQFAGQRPGFSAWSPWPGSAAAAQAPARAAAPDRPAPHTAASAGLARVRGRPGRPGDVGVQRALHEFARGQEPQVGGDAVFGRQRRLQPAPHRHLRDQHRVRRQQRLPGRRRAQFGGQQAGQHLQRWSGRGGSRWQVRASRHLAAARSHLPRLAALAMPRRAAGAVTTSGGRRAK